MDQQTFRQAISILSGEHSLSVLRALRIGTAKGVFQAALQDAMHVYPDLAIRCGLTRPLES